MEAAKGAAQRAARSLMEEKKRNDISVESKYSAQEGELDVKEHQKAFQAHVSRSAAVALAASISDERAFSAKAHQKQDYQRLDTLIQHREELSSSLDRVQYAYFASNRKSPMTSQHRREQSNPRLSMPIGKRDDALQVCEVVGQSSVGVHNPETARSDGEGAQDASAPFQQSSTTWPEPAVHPSIASAMAGRTELQDSALREAAASLPPGALLLPSTRLPEFPPNRAGKPYNLSQAASDPVPVAVIESQVLQHIHRSVPVRFLQLPLSSLVRPSLDFRDWHADDALARQLLVDLPARGITALNLGASSPELSPSLVTQLLRHIGGSLRVMCADACPCMGPRVFGSMPSPTLRRLRALSLARCLGFDDDSASLVARSCQHLEVISVRGCPRLTDGGLSKVLLRNRKSLKAVSAGMGQAVGKGACQQLHRCRRLEVFDASDSAALDDSCLEILFGGAGHPYLRSLGLARCPNVSSTGMQYICGTRKTEGYRVDAKAKYPRLTMLDCSGCESLLDDLSSYILRGAPYLRSIDVSGCTSITDTVLGSLSHARRLEVARLADCREITDAGVARFLGATAAAAFGAVAEKIGDGAAMLREAQADAEVTAREITLGLAGRLAKTIGQSTPGVGLDRLDSHGAGAAAFDATLPKDVGLRAKTLGKLYHSAHHQFARLAALAFDPRHEPKESSFPEGPTGRGLSPTECPRLRLKWLDLTGCQRLSDHSMFLIAKYCPKIGAISCSDAPGITDAGLDALARAEGAARMQVIRFENCRSITGVGAARLLAAAPRLTVVSFAGSSNVGDEIGVSIQELHQLRDLDLSRCLRVSDRCIVGLPRGLRHMRLRGVPHVTDDGVQRVVLSGKCLETLDVGHCNRVSQAALLPLLHKGGRSEKGQLLCPSLHTIDVSGCDRVDPNVLRAIAALRRRHGVFARHQSFQVFVPGQTAPGIVGNSKSNPKHRDAIDMFALRNLQLSPVLQLAPLRSGSNFGLTKYGVAEGSSGGFFGIADRSSSIVGELVLAGFPSQQSVKEVTGDIASLQSDSSAVSFASQPLLVARWGCPPSDRISGSARGGKQSFGMTSRPLSSTRWAHPVSLEEYSKLCRDELGCQPRSLEYSVGVVRQGGRRRSAKGLPAVHVQLPDDAMIDWMPWARACWAEMSPAASSVRLPGNSVADPRIPWYSVSCAQSFGTSPLSKEGQEYRQQVDGDAQLGALARVQIGRLRSDFEGITWDARLVARVCRQSFRSMSRKERRAVGLLERFWMHASTMLARRGIEWAVERHHSRAALVVQCGWRCSRARRELQARQVASRSLSSWARNRLKSIKKNRLNRRATRFMFKRVARSVFDALVAACAAGCAARGMQSVCVRNRYCRGIGNKLRMRVYWSMLMQWWRANVTATSLARRALEFCDGSELRSRFARWKRCTKTDKRRHVGLVRVFLQVVPTVTRNCQFHLSRRVPVEARHRRAIQQRFMAKLVKARAIGKAKRFKAIALHRRLAMRFSDGRRAFEALKAGIQIEQREQWLLREAIKTGNKRRLRRVFRAFSGLVAKSSEERKKFLLSVVFSHTMLKRKAFAKVRLFVADVRRRKRMAAALFAGTETALKLRCLLALRARVAYQRHQQDIFRRAASLNRMQLTRRSFRRIQEFNAKEKRCIGQMVRGLQAAALRIGFEELQDGVRIAKEQFQERLDYAVRQHGGAIVLQSWWRGRRSVRSTALKLARLRRVAGLVEEAWHSRGLRIAARRIAGMAKAERFWRHERERLQMEVCEVQSRRLEKWVAAANRIGDGFHEYQRRLLAYRAQIALRHKRLQDKAAREAERKRVALARQKRIAEFRRKAPLAVERIIAAWRGFAERHLRCSLQKKRLAWNSAVIIQKNYRQRLARYRADAILRMRDDQLRRQARLQQEASSVRSFGFRHRLEQEEAVEQLRSFPWYFSLSEVMVIPELSIAGIVDGFVGLFGCKIPRRSRAVFSGYDHAHLHKVALRTPLQELWGEIGRDMEISAYALGKTYQMATVTGVSSRARTRKTQRLLLERISVSVPDLQEGDGARIVEPSSTYLGQTGTVLHRQLGVRFGGRAVLKMDDTGQMLKTYLTYGGQSDLDAFDAIMPVSGEFDSTGSSMIPERRQRLPFLSPTQWNRAGNSLRAHAQRIQEQESRRTSAIRIQKIVRMRLAWVSAERERRLRELDPSRGQLGHTTAFKKEDVSAVTKVSIDSSTNWVFSCFQVFGKRVASAAERKAARRQNELRHLLRARKRWIRDTIFRRNLAASAGVPVSTLERVVKSRQRLEAMERADEKSEWHQLAEQYRPSQRSDSSLRPDEGSVLVDARSPEQEGSIDIDRPESAESQAASIGLLGVEGEFPDYLPALCSADSAGSGGQSVQATSLAPSYVSGQTSGSSADSPAVWSRLQKPRPFAGFDDFPLSEEQGPSMVADLSTVGEARGGLRRRWAAGQKGAASDYAELSMQDNQKKQRLQTPNERSVVVQTPQAALRRIGSSANVHMPSRAVTAPAVGRAANMSADASIGAGGLNLVSATESKRLALQALRQVQTAAQGQRSKTAQLRVTTSDGNPDGFANLSGVGNPSILLDAQNSQEPREEHSTTFDNTAEYGDHSLQGFIAGENLLAADAAAAMPRRAMVVGSAAGRARGELCVPSLGELALLESERDASRTTREDTSAREVAWADSRFPGFRVGLGSAVGANAVLPRSAAGSPPEVIFLRWRERTMIAVLSHRARYLFAALTCYPIANQLQLRHEVAQARARGDLQVRQQSPRRPALTIEDDLAPSGRAIDEETPGNQSTSAVLGARRQQIAPAGVPAPIEAMRSTSNLHDLDMRTDQQVSDTAAWCGGLDWQQGHVAYRTWVGRYTFDDLRHSPHVTADGQGLYHGEWSEICAAQGHPHGRGYIHFLSDHPRFNPDFNRWPEYYARLKNARDRLLATRVDRPYGELYTGAEPDVDVRQRMARLVAKDEAMSIAIAAQAEAVTVGAEPRSLALDAVASLARKLETEARRDRVHLERAARRSGAGPTHMRGRRLEAALQREREAQARRLEWLRLRDYARRQQYLEAVRRADEIARAAIGDNPQMMRDAWGSGSGADTGAAVGRAIDNDLDDVATPRPESRAWDAFNVGPSSPREAGQAPGDAAADAIRQVAGPIHFGYRLNEFDLPGRLELSPLCNRVAYEQMEGEFRHGYVGGLVSIWFRDGSEYSGPYVSTLPEPPERGAPRVPLTFDEELRTANGGTVGRSGVAEAGGPLLEITLQALSPISEALLPPELRGSTEVAQWVEHGAVLGGSLGGAGADADPLDLGEARHQGSRSFNSLSTASEDDRRERADGDQPASMSSVDEPQEQLQPVGMESDLPPGFMPITTLSSKNASIDLQDSAEGTALAASATPSMHGISHLGTMSQVGQHSIANANNHTLAHRGRPTSTSVVVVAADCKQSSPDSPERVDLRRATRAKVRFPLFEWLGGLCLKLVRPPPPVRGRSDAHWGVWVTRDGWRFEGPQVDNHFNSLLCTARRAVVRSPDGHAYDGAMFLGKRHGRGVMRYESGTTYDGWWREGVPSGPGVVLRPTGHKLVGTFLHGLPHGICVETDSAGGTFVGEFVHGVKMGFGVLRSGLVAAAPVGGVQLPPHLQEGVLVREVHVGHFAGNKPHGLGARLYRDGSLCWGEWKFGQRSGYGVWEWPAGTRYDGAFHEDHRHGDAVVSVPAPKTLIRRPVPELQDEDSSTSGEVPLFDAPTHKAAKTSTAGSTPSTVGRAVSLRRPYRPRWSGQLVDDLAVRWVLIIAQSRGRATNRLGDMLSAEVRRVLEASRRLYRGEHRWERRVATEWKHDHKVRTLGELVSDAATQQFKDNFPLDVKVPPRREPPATAFRDEGRDGFADDVADGEQGQQLSKDATAEGDQEVQEQTTTATDSASATAVLQDGGADDLAIRFDGDGSDTDNESGYDGTAAPSMQERVWQGLLASTTSAVLPRLPPGVDAEDPDVRRIVDNLKGANPEVAGTRGILLSKQELQREYGSMKRERHALRRLEEAAADAKAASDATSAEVREAELALSKARGKLRYAEHSLNEYWHENDPTRTKAEYLTRIAQMEQLTVEQWEELRLLKEPLAGPARLLRPVSRALAVLTASKEGWTNAKTWFADSDWCHIKGIEVSGAEGGQPVSFRARIVHELKQGYFNPYVVGQSVQNLLEAKRLLYGDPKLRPDSEEVLKLPTAAQAVIGFLRALHSHAEVAAPAYRLWLAYTSALIGVQVHQGAGGRAIEHAEELRTAAVAAEEAVERARGALSAQEVGLRRWVSQCQEAREMVRTHHGDQGLVEVDADMTPPGFSVPESILPLVEQTGAQGRDEGFVPALRPEDRGAMVQLRASVLANLEGERRMARVRAAKEEEAQASATLSGQGRGLGPREGMVLVPDEESGWWYWFDPLTGETEWATRGQVRRAEEAVRAGAIGGGEALSGEVLRELRRSALEAQQQSRLPPSGSDSDGGGEEESGLLRSRREVLRRRKARREARRKQEGGGAQSPARLSDPADGRAMARRVAHESKVAEAVAVMRLDPGELDQARILRERDERREEGAVVLDPANAGWDDLPGSVGGSARGARGGGRVSQDGALRPRRREDVIQLAGPGMEQLGPV